MNSNTRIKFMLVVEYFYLASDIERIKLEDFIDHLTYNSSNVIFYFEFSQSSYINCPSIPFV